MPAPMPVCYPAPAAPAAPLACLPPKPMPAPMPVCCPPSAQAGPYACPLPEPMPVQTAVVFEVAPAVTACTATTRAPAACVPAVPCVCPCAAVTTAAKTYTLYFVSDKDKGWMEHRGEDGSISRVQRRTWEIGAMAKLSMSAGKTCLHVKGCDWKAYAEQIDIREDGRLTLRGNVRLMCDKLGVCASVKAEELCVEVKKGKFDKFVTK